MSTKLTDLALKQTTPTGKNLSRFALNGGKGRKSRPTFTLVGDEIADDVIRIQRLQRGDVVDISKADIFVQNPGTQLIIDIGDDDPAGADPDRYCDGLDVSAGGWFSLKQGGTEVAHATVPYVVQNECWLTATVKAVDTLTADAKLGFHVEHSESS